MTMVRGLTAKRFERSAGVCGVGLNQKIKDEYTKIAEVYEANDQLFLFSSCALHRELSMIFS